MHTGRYPLATSMPHYHTLLGDAVPAISRVLATGQRTRHIASYALVTGMTVEYRDWYGLSAVMGVIERICRWSARFRGIATKHVPRYLAWDRFLATLEPG